MAEGTIRVVIDPTGAVRGARKVKTELQTIREKMFQTQTTAKKTSTSMAGFTKSLIGPVGVVVGLAAMAKALTDAVRVSATFEAAVSELSAITGAAGEDLEFLSDKAKELGAASTLGATQVAQGFKLIASAKPELLESGEALAAVTKEAITLAEAAKLDLPTAAKALAGSLNQFGEGAEEAARFINVLAAGSQKGATEIPQLTESLKVAGTVAAGAGLSFETTIAAIETLGEVEIKGAEAGTNLRNVILRLQQQGIDQINPKVVGLTQAFRNLNQLQLTDIELIKIFGAETVSAATALSERTKRTDELQTAITGTNTAQEQAEINNMNLEGQLKLLGSAYEGLQIAIGENLLPVLTTLAQNLIITINLFNSGIQVVSDFSDAIGDFFDTTDSRIRRSRGQSARILESRLAGERQILKDLQDPERIAEQSRVIIALEKELKKAQATEAAAAVTPPTPDERPGRETGNLTDKAAEDIRASIRSKAAASTADKEAEKIAENQKRLAEEQQSAFIALRAELDPLRQAKLDLAEAEKVLNEQFRLQKIDEEELNMLTAQLRENTAASIDPVAALHAELQKERDAIGQTSEQLAINEQVQARVSELKAAGVDVSQEQTEALREELEEIAELNKMWNDQQAILQEIEGPQEALNDRLAALSSLLANDSISLEQFNEKLTDLRAKTLAGQSSVEAGFERGFIKAQENLNDFASLSEKIVTKSFGGMEDGIVNFAKTGKAEFSGLVDQILEDIVRLEARRALSSFFGNAGQEGGAGGSGLFGGIAKLFAQSGGTDAPGGPPGQGAPAGGGGGASGFAGIAGSLATLFASNQDGGIETTPTISRLAEKGPEAIIPLKGGKVPVEVKNTPPPAIIQNTFNITTPDPGAFNRSTGQIGNMVGQSFQRAMGRNG